MTSHTSDLGAFTLSYLGQTSQVAQRQLANATLSTAWSYLPNSGDRRLAGISNVGLSTGQFSTYGYTTTPENFISGISETSNSTAVYPGALTQTAGYNNLNQLTNLSGQALSFDADGNLLSDGQRNYTWDAENRLIGISYPGQPGKQTAFAYDGLNRRTAITSTPTGGSATTISYLWCGSSVCQARNASNAATRGYYTEGEFVPGSPAQPYYYGPDQIGSVRRVFASATSAPANSYDPYGRALQSTAPLTDFNYAGMFYNADSGLYLTQYRAYDPVVGRWLSRDFLGEFATHVVGLTPIQNVLSVRLVGLDDPPLISAGDISGARLALALKSAGDFNLQIGSDLRAFVDGPNLYAYVGSAPTMYIDPMGLSACSCIGNTIRTIGVIIGLVCTGQAIGTRLPDPKPRPPIVIAPGQGGGRRD